jgi:hypothetical protein
MVELLKIACPRVVKNFGRTRFVDLAQIFTEFSMVHIYHVFKKCVLLKSFICPSVPYIFAVSSLRELNFLEAKNSLYPIIVAIIFDPWPGSAGIGS